MADNMWDHYNYVTMRSMASQITGISIVCLTICSGTNKKHQRSASMAFVGESPDSPRKGPVTWKMFRFDDVTIFSCHKLILLSGLIYAFYGIFMCHLSQCFQCGHVTWESWRVRLPALECLLNCFPCIWHLIWHSIRWRAFFYCEISIHFNCITRYIVPCKMEEFANPKLNITKFVALCMVQLTGLGMGTDLSANGYAAFIWKLLCHWLKGLQHWWNRALPTDAVTGINTNYQLPPII